MKKLSLILVVAAVCAIAAIGGARNRNLHNCSKQHSGCAEESRATTLKEALSPYFYIGCAVNRDIIHDKNCKANELIRTQYNQLVPENCMKEEKLSLGEGQWFWDDADEYVQFCEDNQMLCIGHCLVWHSQPAEWLFYDNEGNHVTREVLIERMKNYIHTVVGRYKGRVYGWDVCNECFEDDGSMRNSLWRQIIGDDFIELAFRFANEADPDAQLYYNDYSMAAEGKRNAVCQMVRDFKQKGIRIDAVGMQSHNGLSWPALVEYEKSINAFASEGVRVNITELDLNVLPTPEGFGGADINQQYQLSKDMDPYADGIDKKNEAIIAERWQALFMLYRNHADQIDRITLWGVGDADSWMNDWPIPGRHCYALLFDKNYDAKPVVEQIIKLYEK